MRPLKWTELRDLAASQGFSFDRHRGSHYVMTKKGAARPVVIPMRKDLKENIVLSVARTIGTSRGDLEDYINSRRRPARRNRKKR